MSNNKKYALVAASLTGLLVLLGLIALAVDNVKTALAVIIIMTGGILLTASLTLITGRSGRQHLSRSLASLSQRVSKNQERSRRDLRRIRDESKRLLPLITQVQDEVVRSELRLYDSLARHGAALNDLTTSMTHRVVQEMAAQDSLLRSYSPAHPIPSGTIPPSSLASITALIARSNPQRILAVNFDEQALWLHYACPEAELIIVASPERHDLSRLIHGRLRADAQVRVVNSAPTDPGVTHFYSNWPRPTEDVPPVDAIVLGSCVQSDFPAPFVLQEHAQDSALLLLPEDHDKDVVAAWLENGILAWEAEPLTLKFVRASGDPA